MRAKNTIVKICLICNKDFEASRSDKLYCSKNCWNKKWCKDNSGIVKEMANNWIKKNRDKCRKTCKDWRESNKEKFNEINLKYYYDNIQVAKNWYKKNSESVKIKAITWRKLNRDKVKTYWLNRRCYSEPGFTVRKLRERDEDACVLCGCKENVQIEHFIPIKKGGINSFKNCYLICRNCHKHKGTLMPQNYYTINVLKKLELKGIVGEIFNTTQTKECTNGYN